MAITVTGSLQVTISLTSAKSFDLSTPSDVLTSSRKTTITSGTGANQVDQVFHDIRSLASGANEELDLAGSLTNAMGETITFDMVRAIMIYNPDTASTLIIGGAAANAWEPWAGAAGDKLVVRPGGRIYMEAPDANGLDVTAATADKLKIEHGAESSIAIAYEIIIAGAQA